MSLAEAFPHGDVGHEVVGGGAVPVPLAGRGVDGVARADLGDLAAAGLDQAAAFGDMQRLPYGVRVPRGAGAGVKRTTFTRMREGSWPPGKGS